MKAGGGDDQGLTAVAVQPDIPACVLTDPGMNERVQLRPVVRRGVWATLLRLGELDLLTGVHLLDQGWESIGGVAVPVGLRIAAQ